MRKDKSTPGTEEAKKASANEYVPSHLQSVCLEGEEEDKHRAMGRDVMQRENLASRCWGLWPWSLNSTQLGNTIACLGCDPFCLQSWRQLCCLSSR